MALASTLIVVHPDYPRDEMLSREPHGVRCLEVLHKIARASFWRDPDVILVPFGSPEKWTEVAEVDELLRQLQSRARHVCPEMERGSKFTAAEWIRSILPPGRSVVCGFWRDLCVRDVAALMRLPIAPELSLRSPPR